jgi:hypothetical protein
MRSIDRRAVLLAVAAAMLAAACGSSGSAGPNDASPTTTASEGTPSPRPESTAELAIVAPKDGQVVSGSMVKLTVSLKRARLVPTTTTEIVPDEGHLHVLLDDRLVSMTSGLSQRLDDVAEGQHLLKVEFVASDHVPFDPRVIVAVAFEVSS